MNSFSLPIKIIFIIVLGSLSACSSIPARYQDMDSANLASEKLVNYPTTHDQQANYQHHYLLGRIAAGQENYQLALDHYLLALDINTHSELAAEALVLSEQLHDSKSTLLIAQKWVLHQNNALIPWKLIAYFAVKDPQQFESDKATLAIERVIALETSSNELLIFLNRLINENNLKPIALLFSDLSATHPSNRAISIATAKIHQYQKHWNEALAITAKLATKHPNDRLILKTHGALLAASGEIEQAIIWYKNALKTFSQDNELHNTLGQLYYQIDRYDNAREQFELILKNSPYDNDAKYMIGAIYYAEENFSQARHYFEPLLRYRRHRNSVLFYLAEIESSNQQFNAAIKFYRQIRNSRYFQTAQMMIARLLHRSGEPDKAFAFLTSLSPKPSEVNYRYMRAMVAAELGAMEITESDLRFILSIEPNHFDALNALGYTLADANKNLAEALDMIKQAYDNDPTSPAIIDSMGWVHYRQGRLKDALNYLQQAYELDTSDEIAAHLGEILWQMDEKDRARTLFASALIRSPESAVIIKVMKQFNILLAEETVVK